MEWWIWLLISIGGYLITGVIFASGEAYFDGYKKVPFCGDDYTMTAFLWPVLVVVLTVAVPVAAVGAAHKLGRERSIRKEHRAEHRKLKQDVLDMCKEEGLDRKKVLKTLVG